MVSSKEIFAALYGAYRLAHFDDQGMRYFDTTIPGFWRSFFAAVLVAPLYLVLLLVRYPTLVNEVPLGRFVAIELIAYVIAWVAFPLIMVSVAKAIDREDNFIRYIVAYNWAAVLQNGLYLPIAIMASSGVLPEAAATTLGLLALLAIVIYTWFITRTALDIQSGMAAGIVGLDFLLSVIINAIADGVV